MRSGSDYPARFSYVRTEGSLNCIVVLVSV